jgi:hypothetical protein
LDFSAFFAAFLAAFAAFFALLVFLAIWCGPRIVVARSWAALCMSQGPPIFKEPFFSLNHFLLWLRISRHQDESLALSPTGFRSTVAPPPQGENAASNGKCSGLRQPFVRKRASMAGQEFPLSIDRRRLLVSAVALPAASIGRIGKPARAAAAAVIQSSGMATEAEPANFCAARNLSPVLDRSMLVDVACTRFRRHRVRCFYGTGGESWRDGSLPESSSLRRCG